MARASDDPERESVTTPPAWRLTREKIERRGDSQTVPTGGLRLGGGEFVATESDAVTDHARRLFLQSVRDVAPEVLSDLAQAPLAAFYETFLRFEEVPWSAFRDHANRASSWLLPTDSVPAHVVRGGLVPAPVFLVEGLARRHAVLREWAQRWNLHSSDDDWVIWTATNTLLWWCQCRLARQGGNDDYPAHDGREWSYGGHLEPIRFDSEETRVTFPAFDWNPQLETRADAKKRIRADLHRILDDQLDRISLAARDRNMVRPVVKTTGSEHFRWFVRWQVQGTTLEAIADQVQKERTSHGQAASDPPANQLLTASAVQDAIANVSALVGIERRSLGQGGRPPKRRTPRTVTVRRARP